MGAPAGDDPTSPSAHGRGDGASPPTGAPGAGRPPRPPRLPWTAWSPGMRVVVRYRLADGLHDALGDLEECAPDHVTIRTRRGSVRVEAATMVTGKEVPPAAW